jgi:hypothetical protein
MWVPGDVPFATMIPARRPPAPRGTRPNASIGVGTPATPRLSEVIEQHGTTQPVTAV